MPSLAAMLMATAAAIIFALGGVHLVYTFFGEKFHPRDPAVHEAMQSTPLVITRQTTLWRAWIGFNASHSQGAILFGLVFGFLSLQAPALLFGSLFLGLTGFAMLAGYLVLARRYWFRVPLVGISLAMAFYVAAWILGVR